MSIRILQIAHDHPDWTAGGTEILAHDLTRALAARDGVTARFLATSTSLQRPDARPGALGAHGADLVLHTGAYDRFSMTRLDGTEWLASLARALDMVRPDIVHLHGIDRIGGEVIPALRRLAPKARILLTLHDYQLICPNDGLMLTTADQSRCDAAGADRCRRCFPEIAAARHALRQAHLKALLDPVDAFIAPSQFLRDRFIDWGLPPEKIRLIRNSVQGQRLAPAAHSARPNRFAFFGNLSAHKGILVLLEAAARLRDADLTLSIHGGLGHADAAFRAEFAARLREAGPTAQHIGPYARAELQARMASCDWVVIPSLWWENAPLVLIEARMAGRPVIASDLGGLAESITHGIDGLLVPPGDAAALAECLRDAATRPDLHARLARTAEGPDHAAFVDRHLELYASLANRVSA